MNVRRPERDEQPWTPRAWYAPLNQLTMLSGVMGPPRSDRMTGPVPSESASNMIRASLNNWWSGISRPLQFLAVMSCSSIRVLTAPSSGQHHQPRQMCDFSGSQASFHRKENDDAVSLRVSENQVPRVQ